MGGLRWAVFRAPQYERACIADIKHQSCRYCCRTWFWGRLEAVPMAPKHEKGNTTGDHDAADARVRRARALYASISSISVLDFCYAGSIVLQSAGFKLDAEGSDSRSGDGHAGPCCQALHKFWELCIVSLGTCCGTCLLAACAHGQNPHWNTAPHLHCIFTRKNSASHVTARFVLVHLSSILWTKQETGTTNAGRAVCTCPGLRIQYAKLYDLYTSAEWQKYGALESRVCGLRGATLYLDKMFWCSCFCR